MTSIKGLKDQISIAKNGFDEVHIAIIKCTSKKIKTLKLKHIATLTSITWQPASPLSELFKILGNKIRDTNWIIVYKALSVTHILIKEGNTERVLGYLAAQPLYLNLSNFKDSSKDYLAVEQSKYVRAYAKYLEEKIIGFRDLKKDPYRNKDSLIDYCRTSDVEDGLLDTVIIIQNQLNAIISCRFYLEEIDNLVTLQSFRLLLGDLMALFLILNEGIIKILSEFFGMEKNDAKKALDIYKNFSKDSEKVSEFLDTARKLKNTLGIDIPEITYAPISLARSLEEYLNQPNHERNRLEFVAKQNKAPKAKPIQKPAVDNNKTKGSKTNLFKSESKNSLKEKDFNSKKITKSESSNSLAQQEEKSKKQKTQEIDFFASLDEELGGAFTAQQQQVNNFAQFNIDPFAGFANDNDSNFGDFKSFTTQPIQNQNQLQLQPPNQLVATNFTIQSNANQAIVPVQNRRPSQQKVQNNHTSNQLNNTKDPFGFDFFAPQPQTQTQPISVQKPLNNQNQLSSLQNPFDLKTLQSQPHSRQSSSNQTFGGFQNNFSTPQNQFNNFQQPSFSQQQFNQAPPFNNPNPNMNLNPFLVQQPGSNPIQFNSARPQNFTNLPTANYTVSTSQPNPSLNPFLTNSNNNPNINNNQPQINLFQFNQQNQQIRPSNQNPQQPQNPANYQFSFNNQVN